MKLKFDYRHNASELPISHWLVKNVSEACSSCGVESSPTAMTASTDAVFYHENGQLYLSGKYLAGEQTGAWEAFNKNGTFSYAGSYENGEETGDWKMYYETGELKSMGEFVNGKMQGLWKDYFKQGKLMKTGNYASGFEHGEWKSYFETGEIYQTRLYNAGLVMEIISEAKHRSSCAGSGFNLDNC